MSSLDQFLEVFFTESAELLVEMEQLLSEIDQLEEGEAVDKDVLNAVFRCAHSIKGGAGAFGFEALTGFTHELETLLDKLRDGLLAITPPIVLTLLRSVDVMAQMLECLKAGDDIEEGFGDEVKQQLEAQASGQAASDAAPQAAAAMATAAPEETGGENRTRFTLRLQPDADMLASGNEILLVLRELTRELTIHEVMTDDTQVPDLEALEVEHCYLDWQLAVEAEDGEDAVADAFAFIDGCSYSLAPAEEATRPEPAAHAGASVETDAPAPVAAKPAAGKKPASEKAAGKRPAHAEPATSTIRVDLFKIDRMVNMVSELVITQAMISAQTGKLPLDQYPELLHGVDELYRHSRELQEAVMAVRMQPVKSVFMRMPRIVRALADQLGKDIRLVTEGENTEIDQTVIEQLVDPLTHMIRNSVDHGIESPEKREAAGKKRQGTIRLSASHESGRIVIEIADDGAGINRERVRKIAIERGVIAAEQVLSDKEIDMLIFAPGFSTAEAVTDVSGRGVGMDVVRSNIEEIGGTVDIRSIPGEGATMRIQLPLTLAILDGMIVRVAQEKYIVPIIDVIEMVRPEPGQVQNIARDTDVFNLRNEFIPLVYLGKAFRIFNAKMNPEEALVLVVQSGDLRYGLVVDELICQQQFVIKSLEENSRPVKGVSGATILGDGSVSLILDIIGIYAIGFTGLHTPKHLVNEALLLQPQCA